MKLVFFCCAMMVWAARASAQEFKDDSILTVPDADKGAFLSALITTVTDPFSTQVLGLRAVTVTGSEEYFCGLINTKNSNGVYTGFKPFRFFTKGPRLYLDAKCNP